MILGPLSGLDCIVFLVLLAPQLLLQAGLIPTLICGLQALPFLLVKLPLGVVRDRFFLRIVYRNGTSAGQPVSWFEDVVIRCIRYGFEYIPPKLARVFFSKQIALPLIKFRILRHGYVRSPVHWVEVNKDSLKGLLITEGQSEQPDIVIFYVHGGGFAMGSVYFYLEVLLLWLSLLKSSGFQNPAIFAIEYTLVPDKSYPVQVHETVAGYKYACSLVSDPARICVAGDSAGATLILSLLLHLGRETAMGSNDTVSKTIKTPRPGMAVVISPWVTLLSSKNKNTARDYLNMKVLQRYAHHYCDNKISLHDPRISPGNCKDIAWWQSACPSKGIYVTFGSDELFAPDIRELLSLWKHAGIAVRYNEEKYGIHAWPVAGVFLSRTWEERQKGTKIIVDAIKEHMNSKWPLSAQSQKLI